MNSALQLDVAGSQQLVGPGPSPPSIGETKTGGQVLRAGHKRFFFDLGSNQKGDFLRITEVSLSDLRAKQALGSRTQSLLLQLFRNT